MTGYQAQDDPDGYLSARCPAPEIPPFLLTLLLVRSQINCGLRKEYIFLKGLSLTQLFGETG